MEHRTRRRRPARPPIGLGRQLAGLTILVLAVTLGVGGYALSTFHHLQATGDERERIDELARVEAEAARVDEALRGDVLARFAGTGTPDAREHLRQLTTIVVELGRTGDPEAARLADDEYVFGATAQRLLEGGPLTGADVARFRAAAAEILGKVDVAQRDLDERDGVVDREAEDLADHEAERLAGITVLGAVLLAGAAWLIRRLLLAELAALAAAAQAVAAGDLSARSGRAGDDEIGRLARVLDETSDTLQQAIDEREADVRRQEFRARLDRALAQADTDPSLSDTVGRALAQVVPRRSAELLIADASEAHLFTFASNPQAEPPGCRVSTPWACPAVRAGQTAEFASSRELDACHHLRERPGGERSGVCIPIGFMGRVLGVLHTAAEPGDLPDPEAMGALKALAEQAGSRLGNLRAFERIQRQAAVDNLTGLPNRRAFEDTVHKLSSRGTPYGLLLADLDHFKSVNDTYGHAAGDRALQTFADTLRSALRDQDLPCRFGGEEFAVVLPDVEADGALEVAERVRVSLALALLNTVPAFTVSIGVSDSTMARDLAGQLALADVALLAAKRQGRDRCLVAGGYGDEPLLPTPRDADGRGEGRGEGPTAPVVPLQHGPLDERAGAGAPVDEDGPVAEATA